MNRTNIEYLDFTWNPLAMRCTPVSEGCANCWHLALCNRLSANPKISMIKRNAYAGLVGPQLIQGELEAPLRRKKPAIIGVQFMGDLFHEDVTYEQQVEIFQVIAEASWHTILILTKRPKNMFDFIQSIEDWEWYHFQHVWWGVTAENQQTADERIPILLQIPAAKRFVSIEPMLGPVDLGLHLGEERYVDCGGCKSTPVRGQPYCLRDHEAGGLDWVIAGCESGSKRRPTKIEWFRELKNQCVEAGVPFFLKQMATEPPTMAGCETGLPMYYENFKSKVIKMPELDGKIWNERP